MDSTYLQQELELSLRPSRAASYAQSIAARSFIRERRVASTLRRNYLAKVLGIKLGLSMTKAYDGSSWNFFARWHVTLPLGLSKVFTAQMRKRDGMPTLPKLGLQPQNIISPDSEIIKACEACDLPRVQQILKARETHPNDRTPEDFTVFRYAVRTGNPEIVQLLLDHGADPNLSFGELEESPLQNAFLIANVAIIRLLLNANADIYYKDVYGCTCLFFLWDPERTAPTSATEILGIREFCFFDAWNDTCRRGWSASHRAGAFARGEDIYNLAYNGANMHAYTTNHLWGPMTCAVWNSNEDTFDAFMELLPTEEIINITDSRGWKLLHFAAQRGCEYIMRRLLAVGADPNAQTVGTETWVSDALAWKVLTPEMIAVEYGFGDMWQKLLREHTEGTSGHDL